MFRSPQTARKSKIALPFLGCARFGIASHHSKNKLVSFSRGTCLSRLRKWVRQRFCFERAILRGCDLLLKPFHHRDSFGTLTFK